MYIKFDVMQKEYVVKNAMCFLNAKMQSRSKDALKRDFELFDIDENDIDYIQKVTKKIQNVYDEKYDDMCNLAKIYQEEWNKINDDIILILENFFNVKLNDDYCAMLWPSYLCPYYDFGWCIGAGRKEPEFDRVKNHSIHELIHLYWWKVWNDLFKNNEEMLKGDFQSAKWLLSEIAIYVIIKATKLKDFISDINIVANRFCYDTKLKNKQLCDCLMEVFNKSDNIEDFMKKGYDFVAQNRDEILKQISYS